MTVRVLIIDDSATARAILMSRLSREPDILVIGAAADAAEGRALIKRLNPDVVTLDVEMPGMNGLEFLEKIMTLRPTPVIVVSGSTGVGDQATARALALGAVGCYAKSTTAGGMMLEDGGRLATLVREAAQVRFASGGPASTPLAHQSSRNVGPIATSLIAIGSSTGGVQALQTLLRDFHDDCPPTVIVQHVNSRFTADIARTLDRETSAKVQLAEPDLPLRPGNIYLAPGGDCHLTVGGPPLLKAKLRRGDDVSGHTPSVDVLFRSVAEKIGADAVGILLTGMGSDGAQGLLAMAQAGARTIAQDEASCVVFGMPRVAIALGAATIVAPIGSISQHALRQAA